MEEEVVKKEELESQPKKKGRGWKWAGIILILIILCIVGKYAWNQFTLYVRTNDAFIDGYYVSVSPDILARIISLEVDEGDFVEEGQLLVQLDESLIRPERDTRSANVASLEASLRLKIVERQKILDDYERGKRGIRDHIITAQEFDHLQKDFEAAEADVLLAQKNIELAKRQLEELEALLLHTKIVAPRRGMIAKRWGLAGDVLQKGQTIFSLYDLDNIWVLANLQETDISGVKIGSHVEISVDAYPGVTFTGEVFVIKGAAASQFSFIPQDNATGNFTKVAQRVPLKISIHPPKQEEGKEVYYYLFPGMSAEIKIRVE
ncbi:MAG: HlyD family secretion protein [Chlamydiales bacterium]|nr:HlyD family secretion protein [Chlamydiales bacterium]